MPDRRYLQPLKGLKQPRLHGFRIKMPRTRLKTRGLQKTLWLSSKPRSGR
jgi:hypothetical protein